MNHVIIDQQAAKRREAGFWGVESDADARIGSETARHLALRWVVRLRYGLIAGELALIAALRLGLQIELPAVAILPAIGIQTLSNWMLHLRKQQLVKRWESETMIIDVTRKVPPGDRFYEWYRR